jgi:hypothetical protein
LDDLAINLLASLIAGCAVWLLQRFTRFRRLARKQAFFGIQSGSRCTISVSRHASSKSSDSVHRGDVAAVVEIAPVIKECRGETDLIVSIGDRRGIGPTSEFCIGGPHGNKMTAAHLKRFVPGFRINAFEEDPEGITMFVGDKEFRQTRGQEEFVLLIRIPLPGELATFLWIICGQTARSNRAAAQYLALRHRLLIKNYGTKKGFCLALRLLDSQVYDHNQLEVVGDLANLAFNEPMEIAG